MTGVRDARREARERLAGRYEVRVLEPSPPAVDAAPFFADDPPARGEVPAAREVVMPVPGGDITWHELVAGNPELAAWASERWLGSWRALEPLPDAFATDRARLQAIAENVMKPAREEANGKFGLRWTLGGFGTPFFSGDRQVRVEGARLVWQEGEGIREEPIDVEPASVASLGDFFGFTTSVLEEMRADADAALEASRVQLWPEHFDIAMELGSEDAGERAAYGGSPGDEEHPEPYLYVAPWSAKEHYAELPYAELTAAADQRAAARMFFESGLGQLVVCASN